jgi:hypothetical protein
MAAGQQLATFEDVLRHLRQIEEQCEPPIGVGTFDLLCASEREILVWYTPVREGHRAGEHAIPTQGLAAAWEALRTGTPLGEADLAALAANPAGGRWLLALLAQLPGVRIREEVPMMLEIAP